MTSGLSLAGNADIQMSCLNVFDILADSARSLSVIVAFLNLVLVPRYSIDQITKQDSW